MVFIVNLTKPVILASGSPRRKELLALAGFNFTVRPANGEEVTTKTLPCDIVCELAHQKAFEIAKAQTAPCYVIGADTIVAFENRIWENQGQRRCRANGLYASGQHTSGLYRSYICRVYPWAADLTYILRKNGCHLLSGHKRGSSCLC